MPDYDNDRYEKQQKNYDTPRANATDPQRRYDYRPLSERLEDDNDGGAVASDMDNAPRYVLDEDAEDGGYVDNTVASDASMDTDRKLSDQAIDNSYDENDIKGYDRDIDKDIDKDRPANRSRIGEAMSRDWEQTKHDVGLRGKDLNQDADDTLSQATGGERVPYPNEPTPDKSD